MPIVDSLLAGRALIPLSAIPSQTVNIILDDQYCTVSVYQRQNWMYLDLSVGSTLICQGALCQNSAEIVQSPTPDFKGSLHFWDKDGSSPPHYTGLNTRFYLIFIPEGDEIPKELQH